MPCLAVNRPSVPDIDLQLNRGSRKWLGRCYLRQIARFAGGQQQAEATPVSPPFAFEIDVGLAGMFMGYRGSWRACQWIKGRRPGEAIADAPIVGHRCSYEGKSMWRDRQV